ncbi:hypothetical protein [Sphingobacterium cavernae]|uniref:hypothetical protein n=1 Tax=Sphingobacterium cavernae TaxID=2592657 RepID=UPI001CB7CB7E|nr:hypothetical protein [Sphingobacterium cavernae]
MKAFEPAVKSDSNRKSKKGAYTIERDECILYRYYYYCEIKQIRFDVALQSLESEFFITSTTIAAIITNLSNDLKKIVNEKPLKRELKKKYPHLDWN